MINERGERFYPFKSAVDAKKAQILFNEILRRNRDAGKIAGETGKYPLYNGFKREVMDKLFNIEFLLSEKTQTEIENRVISPMKKIAEELGIRETLVFAGEGDQESHVTLNVGKFENMSAEKQEQILKWLTQESESTNSDGTKKTGHFSHLNELTDVLTELTFKMDSIFNSGRDTSINTSTVETQNQGAAYRARHIFERVLDKAQLKFAKGDEKIGKLYPRYDDIFHSTIARFTAPVNEGLFFDFNRRVQEEIGTKLAENPLTIEVSKAQVIIASAGMDARKGGSEVLN